MDLMLLMMDLGGGVCKSETQRRTFSVELSCMYPFFIIADTLQLFLHVKGLHYSIMKQLNINRLNFECLSKQFTEGTVSVTQF